MIWIDTQTAARFLGISDRAVRKNAQAGSYEARWTENPDRGGIGGQRLEIFVGSLPPAAQINIFAETIQLEDPEPARPVPMDGFSDGERREIEQRLWVWRAWRRYCLAVAGQKNKAAATAEFLQLWAAGGRRPKVSSFQTLYRWDNLMREHGPGGLRDARGQSRKGQTSIPADALAFFNSLYLHQNRRTMYDCYTITQFKAEELSWGDLPSYSAFKRFVTKHLDKQVLVKFREGNKAFDDKCMPYLERTVANKPANFLWVSDHHQMDLHALNEGRTVRPWLTLWEDMRSRRVVGFILSEKPNQDVILAAFAQGAVRHGVPDGVYIDNGKDFCASGLFSVDEAHVHSLAHRLGLQVHHAIPYNAKAKPAERVFRTFKEDFSRLWDTYCGGKPDEKPERLKEVLRKARPGTIPTMTQLASLLWDWVEAVYNERPHSGEAMDGQSPRQVHEDTLQEKRVMPADVARLMFMRADKPRKVRRQGIRIFDRWYFAEEMYERQDQEVQVRYDPSAIGRIYVFDLDGRFVCEATNRQMMDFDVSAEDYKKARQEQKQVRDRVRRRYDELTAGAVQFDPVAMIAARRRALDAKQAPNKPQVVKPIRQPELEMAARQIRANEEAAATLEAVGGTPGAFQQWRQGAGIKRSQSQASADAAMRDALRSVRAQKNGGAEK